MFNRPSLLSAAALIGCATLAVSANAITSERFAAGLGSPLFVTAPPGDERVFIVDQAGRILIYDQSGSSVATFLDIDARVLSGGERGLLGFSFSPDYETDRLFYVNYTNNSGNTVIARFETNEFDENDGLEDSEEILLTVSQPFPNHNGGRIAFGADDMLYIGMGDGGSGGDPGNRAQNINTLLGKILRIDVSGGLGSGYSNPADNPYVGKAGLDEIWSIGIRNPWGIDFDPETGDMYMADVGQNAWEEINVEPADAEGGLNYGWRLMEGTHCYDPPSDCNDGSLVLPVHEYSHSAGCSVTGGIIYRGSIGEIDGHYFFADYCTNRIWSFVWDGAGGITDFTDRTSELVPDVGTINSVTGFGRDGLGAMYILGGGEAFRVLSDPIGVPDAGASSAVSLRAAPNPFQGAVTVSLGIAAAATARVTVLDATGRHVRTLGEALRAGTLTWDGTDDTGRDLAAGVYFMEIEAEGIRSRSRVTLVR
jgi:glucose/arabinose dehydrogenase